MCSVCGHREHRNESLRPLRRRRLVVRPQQGKALVHFWGINNTEQVPSQYLKFPISAAGSPAINSNLVSLTRPCFQPNMRRNDRLQRTPFTSELSAEQASRYPAPPCTRRRGNLVEERRRRHFARHRPCRNAVVEDVRSSRKTRR